VFGRRCTRSVIVTAFVLAMGWSVATGGAATSRTVTVPTKLLGVWHKTMTRAEWDRAGVVRDVGVYTFMIEKTGTVTIYKPGDYRRSCGKSCFEDFTTTFKPTGHRLALGPVPVCSFKGVYTWHLVGSALEVRPLADARCIVRATFFGGRWKR
jgi:hypothetical protein